MQVGDIRTSVGPGGRRVTATVSTHAWDEPFELWFEARSDHEVRLEDRRADPWLAALLLPAMRLGEPLELDAPVSAELEEAVQGMQAVYATWMPALSPGEVRTAGRLGPGAVSPDTALFFSCGVDSWYSLLKAEARRALGRPSVTHLLAVHGVDIDVGSRKADVAGQLMSNTRRVAAAFGLGAVEVATNVRLLYTRLGLSWHWGQAGGLAAIGLALQNSFGRVVLAACAPNVNLILRPELDTGGAHSLLVPTFSTLRCEIAIDGGEASRLTKVAAVATSAMALRTLRVCWATHRAEYNCGRCTKCVRTMLELEAVGALGRCPTLPPSLDPDAIANVTVLFPDDPIQLRHLHQRLLTAGSGRNVLDALDVSITRGEAHLASLGRGVETIRSCVRADEPFVVIDDDEVRFELAASHRFALPFTEDHGVFNGFPPDDHSALAELDRLLDRGVTKVVLWKSAFWVLDHYQAFAAELRRRCRLERSTLEVLVFDLAGR